MFKKKLIEEFEAIKPSEQTETTVLLRMEQEQDKQISVSPKKPAKKRWIAAIATAVAVVIVSITAFNLHIFNYKNEDYLTDGSKAAVAPLNITYDQIYEKFTENFKTMYNSEGFDSEDEAVEYTEDNFSDYSTTNTQVEDVDEADIVKTDGEYIYTIPIYTTDSVSVVKAENGKLEEVTAIDVYDEEVSNHYNITKIYISDNRLITIANDYDTDRYSLAAAVKIFDISNLYEPVVLCEFTQSGGYISSRLIDGMLYFFSSKKYDRIAPKKDDIFTYLPVIVEDGKEPRPLVEKDIYCFDGDVVCKYLIISSVDIETGDIVNSKAVVGCGGTNYANAEAIYVASDYVNYHGLNYDPPDEENDTYKNKTRLIRFNIKDGVISAAAEGTVAGVPLNQFSMDEYKGYFRIVTTESIFNKESGLTTSRNGVYILNSNLETVGSITDIAKGESVYSVRFIGDTGYFVTFRKVDPLFAVDLSNPKEPKILSALKIPGFSNYMHPWGEDLLLGLGADNGNEITGAMGGAKLSMFDISDPENVTEKNEVILEDSGYRVGEEHKSVFVLKEKNLIGFATSRGRYYLYGYSSKNGFVQKAVFEVPNSPKTPFNVFKFPTEVRGIYIGDYYYVCNSNGINSYCLSDFKKVDGLIF